MQYLIVQEYTFATPCVFIRDELPVWDELPEWMKDSCKRTTVYEVRNGTTTNEVWSRTHAE